jgi:hypothetical protein
MARYLGSKEVRNFDYKEVQNLGSDKEVRNLGSDKIEPFLITYFYSKNVSTNLRWVCERREILCKNKKWFYGGFNIY